VQTPALAPTAPANPVCFYSAVKRSVVCASPVVRYPSPNCDQAKIGKGIARADSVLVLCRRYPGSSVSGTRGLGDRGEHSELPQFRW